MQQRNLLRVSCVISSLALVILSVVPLHADVLNALIIDGQNNHEDWPKTTAMMKSYLEASGRFQVDVARTKFTWKGESHLPAFALQDGQVYKATDDPRTDNDFQPVFKDYDVVVSNFGYNAAAWPETTKRSFVDYVRNGGGFVVIHSADNTFGDWDVFNRMIGVGGWGGRNEKTGPYIFVNDEGETVRDDSPGNGGDHGPQHEFQLVIRNADHPITNGLPTSWLHTKDELYQTLRGPGEQMTILATAFADKEFKGTGNHEPMMMTVQFEKGRIYHTPMGHADYSMECVGFITTFVRGTEWAATGEVTLTELPEDFPTADKSSPRRFQDAVSAEPTDKANPKDTGSPSKVPADINKGFLDPDLNPQEWLDRFEIESREVFAARKQIVKQLNLTRGDEIADVGAGTGLFLKLFSDAVGETGRVFAVDISPRLLEHLRERKEKESLSNVTIVESNEESTTLPNESVDSVFVCDTYHHFEHFPQMLRSIHESLKDDGQLVVIDFERIPNRSREWILGHVRAGKSVFRSEIERSGFEFVDEVKLDQFKENYFLRFKKRG